MTADVRAQRKKELFVGMLDGIRPELREEALGVLVDRLQFGDDGRPVGPTPRELVAALVAKPAWASGGAGVTPARGAPGRKLSLSEAVSRSLADRSALADGQPDSLPGKTPTAQAAEAAIRTAAAARAAKGAAGVTRAPSIRSAVAAALAEREDSAVAGVGPGGLPSGGDRG